MNCILLRSLLLKSLLLQEEKRREEKGWRWGPFWWLFGVKGGGCEKNTAKPVVPKYSHVMHPADERDGGERGICTAEMRHSQPRCVFSQPAPPQQFLGGADGMMGNKEFGLGSDEGTKDRFDGLR